NSADPEARYVEISLRDWSKEKIPPPDRINIRILSNTKFASVHDDLGTSYAFATSGIQATIFGDSVHRAASEFLIPPPILLGYVIVHEVGHVFLHSTKHSLGIMHAFWSPADYHLMKFGMLDFTVADKAALRRAIQNRLAQNAIPSGIETAETHAR